MHEKWECMRKNTDYKKYLCPFISLRVIGFHSVQVCLPIVSTYCIQPVTKETDTNSISRHTQWSHHCPCVSFWIIPNEGEGKLNAQWETKCCFMLIFMGNTAILQKNKNPWAPYQKYFCNSRKKRLLYSQFMYFNVDLKLSVNYLKKKKEN